MDPISGGSGKVEGYTLKDVLSCFETVVRDKFDPDQFRENGTNMAEQAFNAYSESKQIIYDQPKQQLDTMWEKGKTVQVVNINDPIKMLNSVVILFQDESSTDSEKIDVAVEGKSNLIYE